LFFVGLIKGEAQNTYIRGLFNKIEVVYWWNGWIEHNCARPRLGGFSGPWVISWVVVIWACRRRESIPSPTPLPIGVRRKQGSKNKAAMEVAALRVTSTHSGRSASESNQLQSESIINKLLESYSEDYSSNSQSDLL
jgi:hypothetical protein